MWKESKQVTFSQLFAPVLRNVLNPLPKKKCFKSETYLEWFSWRPQGFLEPPVSVRPAINNKNKKEGEGRVREIKKDKIFFKRSISVLNTLCLIQLNLTCLDFLVQYTCKFFILQFNLIYYAFDLLVLVYKRIPLFIINLNLKIDQFTLPKPIKNYYYLNCNDNIQDRRNFSI